MLLFDFTIVSFIQFLYDLIQYLLCHLIKIQIAIMLLWGFVYEWQLLRSILRSKFWLLRLTWLIVLVQIMKVYSCWRYLFKINLLGLSSFTLNLSFSCSVRRLCISWILSERIRYWVSFERGISLQFSILCLCVNWLSIWF